MMANSLHIFVTHDAEQMRGDLKKSQTVLQSGYLGIKTCVSQRGSDPHGIPSYEFINQA